MNIILEHLKTRRSIKAQSLIAPGPSNEELEEILLAANRVPDHKKLGPWRFIIFTGAANNQAGVVLAKRYKTKNPEATDKLAKFEESRFTRAPLVVGVVVSPRENDKVPRDEQVLSVGAVCQNLIIAATSLGYGAQWLTEWYSYDENIAKSFGLKDAESFAGFIYIGSFNCKPEERARADLKERISYFNTIDPVL